MTTMTMKKKRKAAAPKPRRRGRPSRFPGKDRETVITLTMSPGGHDALARLQAREPELSRAEVIEQALRKQAN